ncbi:hypothetical protein [Myceligenerans halotolerans]
MLRENDIEASGRYDSVDAFIADLEKLRKAGMEAPLALGTTWTQVHLFETVLLGSLGAEAYTGLWDGSTDWNSPEVTAALEDFKTVLGSRPARTSTRTSSPSTRRWRSRPSRRTRSFPPWLTGRPFPLPT